MPKVCLCVVLIYQIPAELSDSLTNTRNWLAIHNYGNRITTTASFDHAPADYQALKTREHPTAVYISLQEHQDGSTRSTWSKVAARPTGRNNSSCDIIGQEEAVRSMRYRWRNKQRYHLSLCRCTMVSSILQTKPTV